MNSKFHLTISLLKSIIRIVSVYVAILTGNWIFMGYGFVIAETMGITEELGDKR